MVRITEELLRRKAGPTGDAGLSELRELALHGLGIERLEYIGSRCRELRVLILQNNIIPRIENLQRLKELEYLNLALNNITVLEGLNRCESLRHIDLTLNFIPASGLAGLEKLAELPHLRRLSLLGNPCTHWKDYRLFVLSALPELEQLDGQDVTPEERAGAHAQRERLKNAFAEEIAREELASEDLFPLDGSKQSWSIATRLNDARAREERETIKQSAAPLLTTTQFITELPPLPEGQMPLQKNQGGWKYRFSESNDARSLELCVEVGLAVSTTDLQIDIQASFVRLLITGRLLQLHLPEEVCPGSSLAQRSRASGRLVLVMPKAGSQDGPAMGEGYSVVATPKHASLPLCLVHENLCSVPDVIE